MQCLLYKIYFWKGFSYVLQIDMHLICAPMLAKFYSCKKWVLQVMSLRFSWATMASELRGRSPLLRRWARLILRYAKHRTCSKGRGSTLRKSGSASQSLVPCSRSESPPKCKRWWQREHDWTRWSFCSIKSKSPLAYLMLRPRS
jgi:hypothetical protein